MDIRGPCAMLCTKYKKMFTLKWWQELNTIEDIKILKKKNQYVTAQYSLIGYICIVFEHPNRMTLNIHHIEVDLIFH